MVCSVVLCLCSNGVATNLGRRPILNAYGGGGRGGGDNAKVIRVVGFALEEVPSANNCLNFSCNNRF